jgi:putative heme-binding domain-containing protein
MAAKYVLGINTLQLNRAFDYGSTSANQLAVYDRLGLFGEPLPHPPEELPRVVDYRDESRSTADRARGYLHANCSHCHRKWGGGNAEFLLLSTVGLDEMRIADVPPAHGAFFIPDARILAPGAPQRSTLYYRMAKLGPGRMPRLGSSEVDELGLRLIRDWIAGLSDAPDQSADLVASLNGASSAESREQRIGELLGNTQTALEVLEAVDENRLDADVRDQIIELASASSEAQVRDLFERFLPEEQRIQRLGNVIRPQTILALEGDAGRGRILFFEAAGVQCRNCHKISGTGRDVGPDLSEIGKKYAERGRLLDTILNPSREIDPKYRVHLVQTTDGRVFSGLLVEQSEAQITLKDAENKTTQIAAPDVEEMVPQQTSLMPELLLRDMTGQQVADLLEFLGGLR